MVIGIDVLMKLATRENGAQESDTLFGVVPGRICPPWAYDYAEMVKSWGKLLSTSCVAFFPSHGTERSRALAQREYEKRRVRSD